MRTPSYLDRYRAGEQTEVWAELVALGPAVRQEPLLSDALAIARETMHRVRENTERLIPRLEHTHYQFAALVEKDEEDDYPSAISIGRTVCHRTTECCDRCASALRMAHDYLRELPADLFPLGRFPWFRTVS
jgi:hypothetical protein